MTEVENRLRDLGEATIAASKALQDPQSEETAAKIEQIGQLLTQASQNMK